MNMLKKVCQTIEKYDLLERGDRVVVALSGGPDSTALLAVLNRLARKMDLTLIVAHFNHGLRGRESDADEKFSHELAKKMGLSFCPGRMDGKKYKKGVSPEDFYRRQRYDFLEKVAKEYRAQKIALGHNLQDQAETVLLHLLRGSGLEGLKGFLPKRDGKIIRPLMEISRTDILSFLNKSGIACRQDSSNENVMYLRNKIRKELIPFLKEKYNPKIEENLAQMAQILRVEDECIQKQVADALRSPSVRLAPRRVTLKIEFLHALLPAVRWRLFKTVLEDLSPAKNGITFLHVQSLENLTQKNKSGKKAVLPLKIEARREYDDLIVERKKASPKRIKYEYALNVPGTTYIKEKKITIKAQPVKKQRVEFSRQNEIYLDWDKIRQPVVIRNRREGDWFQPLGMTGRQKIKDFFIDHKIPSNRRDEVLLLADRLSVIYIENMHLDDRVKITPKTKNALKLELRAS